VNGNGRGGMGSDHRKLAMRSSSKLDDALEGVLTIFLLESVRSGAGLFIALVALAPQVEGGIDHSSTLN